MAQIPLRATETLAGLTISRNQLGGARPAQATEGAGTGTGAGGGAHHTSISPSLFGPRSSLLSGGRTAQRRPGSHLPSFTSRGAGLPPAAAGGGGPGKGASCAPSLGQNEAGASRVTLGWSVRWAPGQGGASPRLEGIPPHSCRTRPVSPGVEIEGL